METRRTVEQWENVQQLPGVAFKVNSIEKINGKLSRGDASGPATDIQTKSVESTPRRKTRFRGHCDDCDGYGNRWRHCPEPSRK